MKDYKHSISPRFHKLEQSMLKTMKKMDKLVKKMPGSVLVPSGLKKNIFITIFILFIISSTFLVTSIIFGNKENIAKNYDVSYIGSEKMKEEFSTMSNTDGVGGSELMPGDTNASELKFFFYKIKQGESLFTISKKLGVSMDTLISLNTMENANSVGEGKRIIIPNLQGILYNIKKNDTLESIADKYKISKEDILDANELEDDSIAEGNILFLPGAQLTEAERQKALGYLFSKPVRGKYTSGFGIRRDPFTGGAGYHMGIDISAPLGTPIRAAKDGRVVLAGWYGGYGRCIIIKHQFGFETVYGHLSRVLVEKDSWIKAGQIIGRLGSTGRSTGPHLHLEVRKFGRPVNPLRVTGLGKSSGRWY